MRDTRYRSSSRLILVYLLIDSHRPKKDPSGNGSSSLTRLVCDVPSWLVSFLGRVASRISLVVRLEALNVYSVLYITLGRLFHFSHTDTVEAFVKSSLISQDTPKLLFPCIIWENFRTPCRGRAFSALISSFKYLDPPFHNQTAGLSMMYMNTSRNKANCLNYE
jgi:hypothetical protein